jgi:hypothetical protein
MHWPSFMRKIRRVVILGLPKSGTTALFYGVRAALPAQHAELFEPMTVEALQPHLTERCFLTKILPTAWKVTFPVSLLDQFTHRIFLVRDPRDVLVSRVLYHIWNTDVPQDESAVRAWLDLLEQKRQQPRSTSLCELIRVNASWRGLALSDELQRLTPATELLHRLQQEAPLHHVLRYEDMVAGELNSLEKYLGLSLKKPFQVGAEVSRVERTRSAGSWKHWFTPEDESVLRPILATYLQAYGYDHDWALAAEPEISAAHSTEYVLRIVNQKRAQAKLLPLS